MIKIIVYTKKEEQALVNIKEKYKPELEACKEELDKFDIATQPDEYLVACSKFNDIHEKIQAEREVYEKQAEQRQFKEFNGDINLIVKTLKNQILNFIYITKILSKHETDTEKHITSPEFINEQKEKIKRGIAENEKLIEQYPDDEELKKNTQELKELDVNLVLESMYSSNSLKRRINENFTLYFNFLLNSEPEAYKELQTFIDNAIKNRDKIEPADKTLKNVKKNDVNVFEIGQYLKLPQGTHTNSLAHKLTLRINDAAQLDLNGKATITDKDFKLYIEGYDRLVSGANTSAVKFFDAAVMTCSKNHDALARITLKEYMGLRGLKDEKEARKQIKNDMEVLKSIKFEYKEAGRKRGDWLSISLYGGRAGIYKGVIEFMFSRDFYASIPENQFMFIPHEYFSTKDKYNPHAAYFIRRIAEHKRMNLGKSNENIIGVETLLNSSPTFPKYEDVNRKFDERILSPFERDMDAIKSIKWHYTEEQPTNYNNFTSSSVVITWEDYPDVQKLTQRKKSSNKEGITPKKRVQKIAK